MIERIPAKQDDRRPKLSRKQLAGAVGVVGCAFLAALFFFSGLTLAPGGRPAVAVDLSAATGEGFHLAQDGSLVMRSEGGTVGLAGLDTDTANLLVEYHAAPERAFPVPVAITMDGDDAYTAGDFLADEATLAPSAEGGQQTFLLRSNGNLHGFSLAFQPAQSEWVITAITLNGGGVSFNWTIFILLCLGGLGVWAVAVFGWWRLTYQDEKKSHRWLARGCAALCALVLIAVFLLGAQPGRRGVVWRYDPDLLPAEQVDEYPGTAFYQLLFDAFWHGQTALRVQPDPALAELDNPYDRSQWGDIPTLWDTSYYGGQYYSYFGPGPMPFYYAFYLVTGRLPSPATACAVPGILLAFALWGTLRQLLNYYGVKPNLILLLLAIPALVFGSLTAMLASCADAYAQPYLWAGLGLCGMVGMLYAAARRQKSWHVRLYYAGAGLCVVMVAACRPALVLVCLAFAAPVVLHMLLRPKDALPTRDKALHLAALATPVLAGAALLMAYNVARFGSPFEFGQAYQLTVGDMRLQGFRWQPAWLMETLRYFLLQPLLLIQRFPFVEMQNGYPLLFGNRFYSDPFFGLDNLPLYWALLLGPLAWARNKKSAGKSELIYKVDRKLVMKATFITVLCTCALVWWVDFSVGNFLYRYLCDASFALALLATLVMLGAFQRRDEASSASSSAATIKMQTNTRAFTLGLGLACAVCVATAVVGLLLAVANDRHAIYLNNAQWYAFFENVFRLR